MSRYDGLIIPRGYNDYISKTDAATLLQALQLSGVMDNEPTANSVHPVKSGGIKTAIDNAVDAVETSLEPVDTVTKDNMHSVTSNAVYKALNTAVSGTATINTSNVNTGTIKWFKLGRLVFVDISALNLKTWSGEDRHLASGLPQPIENWLRFTVPPLNGTTPTQLLAVANGNLYTNGGNSNIGDFYGSFCYISAS